MKKRTLKITPRKVLDTIAANCTRSNNDTQIFIATDLYATFKKLLPEQAKMFKVTKFNREWMQVSHYQYGIMGSERCYKSADSNGNIQLYLSMK